MLNGLLFLFLSCTICLSVCSGEEPDSVSSDTIPLAYVELPPVKSIYLNEISVWDGLPILKLMTPGPVNRFSLSDFRSNHLPHAEETSELAHGGTHKSLGYIGQPSLPTLRGLDPRSVLYLRDGIPVNDELTGVFDLSLLSGVAIEGVDVMSDCGSSTHGPNSCAGVVNLVTKRFVERVPYSRIGAGAGSEGLTDFELEFGRGLGPSWKGYVTGEYLKGDGFRSNTDFDTKDFSGDLFHDFGDTEAGVSLWRRDGKAGIPADTFGSGQAYRLEDRLFLGAAYVRSKELDASLYFKDVWHQDSDTLDNPLGVRTINSFAGQVRKAVLFGRNRLVFGGIGRNRDFEAGDTLAEDIWDGGLTASASLEVLPLLWVSPSVSVWQDEIYGSEVSPKLSASMAYSRGLVFFASVGRGFNSPTALELLSPSGGNRGLEPEHVLSYTGGVRYEMSGLSLELEAFGTETSDPIERNDSTQTPFNAASKERVNGASVRVTASAARLYGGANLRVLASENSGTQREADYAPNMAASGHLGYRGIFRKGDLGINLVVEAKYVGERLSDLNVSLPAYTLLNGCAEIRVIDVRLYYRMENLQDTEYESVSGYPAPGRTFLYGLEWDFWN